MTGYEVLNPPSGVSDEAVAWMHRYDTVCEETAWLMGTINVAFGQLVDVARRALAEGFADGPGLRSPAHWLAWRTGLAAQPCNSIVKLAERAEELPATIAALSAGELTLDQAAEIARHVPADYEASAAEFARHATVRQLRDSLPHYGYQRPGPDHPAPDPEPHEEVRRGRSEQGRWHLNATLDDDRAAVVDAALEAKREDLYRQRRADTPEGTPIPEVTWADAMVAIADDSLAAGAANHPGSDRYLVHLHLQAGADGPVLANHLGAPVSADTRRLLLCDCQLRAVRWQDARPLDIGRKTHTIGRRLRRLIEHRDQGCATPGCDARRGLHIHHIHHWEDGGPTDADNLIALCPFHHRLHHKGLLGIERTPSIASGHQGWITFRDRYGRTLDPTGRPKPPPEPPPSPPRVRYECPSGERLRRGDLVLDPR